MCENCWNRYRQTVGSSLPPRQELLQAAVARSMTNVEIDAMHHGLVLGPEMHGFASMCVRQTLLAIGEVYAEHDVSLVAGWTGMLGIRTAVEHGVHPDQLVGLDEEERAARVAAVAALLEPDEFPTTEEGGTHAKDTEL